MTDEHRKLVEALADSLNTAEAVRLLSDFERKVRLEEAEYYFARRWGPYVTRQKVLSDPTGYTAACFTDAERIAALEKPGLTRNPSNLDLKTF